MSETPHEFQSPQMPQTSQSLSQPPRPDQSMVTLQQEDEKQGLKGTFVSVMLVGGFIALSWLGVFYLFISRM